jgi:hypothetical protein
VAVARSEQGNVTHLPQESLRNVQLVLVRVLGGQLEVVAEDEGRDEDQELHHCDAGEGTDVSECCERMPGTVDVLPPNTRPAEIYNISLVALAASRINAELTWDQRRRL